jgi:pyruvate/2-oxoglutarate dehydrogenase complex dihydrolipoamide dehydrogenase (E3) component
MNLMRAPNLCVVGAGAAGLNLAAAAAMLGARVVLVDQPHAGERLGRDRSINLAALTAAAKAAARAKQAESFGIRVGSVEIDPEGVHRHIEDVRARLTPNLTESRFSGFGVRVIRGTAQFVDPSTIMVEGQRIRARRFVIATGSAPILPTLTGMAGLPVLTEDRPFDGATLPRHLLILGAGPSAAALAQAHARLGCRVTLIAQDRFLPGADVDLAALLAGCLARDGVDLVTGRVVTVAKTPQGGWSAMQGVWVTLEAGAGQITLEGSHLLVAGDRAPATAGLNLEAAGVATQDGAILVDRRLRSVSNPKIFAAGAVASVGGEPISSLPQISGVHAGILVRNLLFRMPSRLDAPLIAQCAPCDPELAWVGLGENEARERDPSATVLRWPLYDNERAAADRTPDGAMKLVVDKRGKLLGAHILAPNASDLIQPWILAVGRRIPISKMAAVAIPTPSLSELGKRAAASFLTPRLFTPGKRRIVKFLARFG